MGEITRPFSFVASMLYSWFGYIGFPCVVQRLKLASMPLQESYFDQYECPGVLRPRVGRAWIQVR
jgi:hypothetical protein